MTIVWLEDFGEMQLISELGPSWPRYKKKNASLISSQHRVILHLYYHVSQRRQFVNDWLSSQLLFADDAGQESSHLEHPPLQAHHEHAGNGQLDEGSPLLQTLPRPACDTRLHGSAIYKKNE